jgi:cytidylate kinase
MVEEQRRVAVKGPVVMAGRDIGTVVLPNAQVKIYPDCVGCGAHLRRQRKQFEAAGVDVNVHRLAEEIEERDQLDRSRAVSPLGLRRTRTSLIRARSMPRVVDEICAIVARAGEIATRRMNYAFYDFAKVFGAALGPRGLARTRLWH